MNTKLLKSMLVFAAIGIADAAHGASYTLSLNTYPGPSLNPGDIANFSNTPPPSSSPFSDNWYFGLNQTSGVGAEALSFNFSAYQISGFTATLYTLNGSGPLGAGGSLGTDWGTVGSGTVLVVPSLSTGEYDLIIAGTATGSAGGDYSGAISTTAVPLPAAAWLLLSGLAGVGLMSRRRPAG